MSTVLCISKRVPDINLEFAMRCTMYYVQMPIFVHVIMPLFHSRRSDQGHDCRFVPISEPPSAVLALMAGRDTVILSAET